MPAIIFFIALTITIIVLTWKRLGKTFNSTLIIITCIIICCCIVTCYLTDPEDPRVYVSGYTRKDGTKVSAYTRRYPNRKDEESPYFGVLFIVSVATIFLAIFIACKHESKVEQKTKQENIDKRINKNEEVFLQKIQGQKTQAVSAERYSIIQKEEREGLSLLEFNKLLNENAVHIEPEYDVDFSAKMNLLDAIRCHWGFIFVAHHPNAQYAKTMFFSTYDKIDDLDNNKKFSVCDDYIRLDYTSRIPKQLDLVKKIVSRIFQSRTRVIMDLKDIKLLEFYGCELDKTKIVPYSMVTGSTAPVIQIDRFANSYYYNFKTPLSLVEESYARIETLFTTLVLTEEEKEKFSKLQFKYKNDILSHFLHKFNPHIYSILWVEDLKSKQPMACYPELIETIRNQGWKSVGDLYIRLRDGMEEPKYRDNSFYNIREKVRRDTDPTYTIIRWY